MPRRLEQIVDADDVAVEDEIERLFQRDAAKMDSASTCALSPRSQRLKVSCGERSLISVMSESTTCSASR
jgi:hypothetical protein